MKRVYAFSFFSECIPIVGVYTVMLAQRHLSTFDISVAVAVWSVSKLLFEVPSGALADRCDRRLVLVASQLITAMTFVVWILFPNIWGYSAGFVLWGAGGALISGTFEALVFDELAARNQSDKFVSVLGRAEAVYYLAFVASAVLAATLVRYGYDTLLWMSSIAGLLGAGLALSFPKAAPRESTEETNYFSDLRHGIKDAFTLPLVARSVVYIAITGCIVDLVTEYAPLFSLDRGFHTSSVAIVMAGLVLLMALASALAARVPGAKLPISIQLVIGAALLLASTFPSMWIAIVVLAVCASFTTVSSVISRAALQHQISDQLRATTTSVGGFFQELLNVVGLILFGVVADHVGRTDAFRWLALVIVAVGAVLAASSFRKELA